MTNQFCPRLTHQLECSYTIDNKLAVKPCCRFKNNITVQNRLELERARNSLKSITDWTENCEFCFKEEASGLESYRQRAFKRFPPGEQQDLLELVVIVDNRCNAACLSCNAASSSLWANFNKKHGLSSSVDSRRTVLSSDRLLSTFDLDSLKALEHLSFIGGEPFYSSAHKDWLRLLKDTADPSKIKLKYTTNGSILPDAETQQLWQHYHSVSVLFSVDAIEDQFHYLRWPLQWHKFERTVDWFLGRENTGVIGFNYTAGLMNLFHAHRLADWIDRVFMPKYQALGDRPAKDILAFNPCRHEIGLDKITPKMQHRYLEQHSTDTRLSKLTMMVSALDLPAISRPADLTMNYINNMDRLRKLDWRQTFPELQEFFEQA